MTLQPHTTPGDSGETDLRAGAHAPKDAARVAAYGALDEVNSALGLARALRPPEDLDATLDHLQRDLFDLGAELSLPPGAAPPAREPRVDAARTAALEAEIDRLRDALPPLHTFILPGGTPAAGALHLARATCRRAERHAVALAHAGLGVGVRPEVVRYLNRLSDLLFVLARAANAQAGLPDAPWHPDPTTPA